MNVTANPPIRSNSFFSAPLAAADPEIARAVELELGRLRDEIELIASENIVSKAVLEAQGSVMTNKYAEGYPGRRYYGGCQFVDMAETLAIERACKLFDCRYANVQPNSGSQANQGVFMALMKPGDTFDRYSILRRIGRGGMGDVYRAHDTKLHRSVALKVLRPDSIEGEGERSRKEAVAI